MVTFIAVAALNIWASWRVCADDLSSRAQRVAQVVFVWLIPIIGALIALQLKRKQPERGSGTYPIEHDAPEDLGAAQIARQAAAQNAEHSSFNEPAAPDQ